jgi:glutaminyl-tRNA synthetase
VSAAHAIDADVRLYDRLFAVENPGADVDFLSQLNPESLQVLTACKLEPSLAAAAAGALVQFARLGYFCAANDTAPGRPVFNRTVTLTDSWAKVKDKEKS